MSKTPRPEGAALIKFLGTKATLAQHYPMPTRDIVVEPFAGGLGYSLYYKVPKCVAIEKDKYIFGMWNFLINDPEAERHIKALPDSLIEPKLTHPKDLQCPEPLRDIVSMWVQRCAAHRCHYISQSAQDIMKDRHNIKSLYGPHVKKRLLDALPLIRNWHIYHSSWEHADWHVGELGIDPDDVMFLCDPPYFNPKQKASMGDHYSCKANSIDFEALGRWCQSKDRIIVCESSHADWLPFENLKQTYNQQGDHYGEAVWMRGMDHSMLTEDDMDVD